MALEEIEQVQIVYIYRNRTHSFVTRVQFPLGSEILQSSYFKTPSLPTQSMNILYVNCKNIIVRILYYITLALS